jgi:hypothetical protein
MALFPQTSNKLLKKVADFTSNTLTTHIIEVAMSWAVETIPVGLSLPRGQPSPPKHDEAVRTRADDRAETDRRDHIHAHSHAV